MLSAAHDRDSSSTRRNTLRRVFACAAAAFLFSIATVYAAPATSVSKISLVTDSGCPLVIQTARAEETPAGIVVVFTLRNDDNDHATQIVVTAATLDWLGGVIDVGMALVDERIPKHSSGEYRATFARLDLGDADRVVFGIQAVRWDGRREEWRAALKLAGPFAIAAARR
ncbi:MAG: hypothetical protein HYU53_03465 [Acidobacteria bacterium]|nr:hypothetical protein [Acidobacteriota bacterium]